jgi:hypothetical protein
LQPHQWNSGFNSAAWKQRHIDAKTKAARAQTSSLPVRCSHTQKTLLPLAYAKRKQWIANTVPL